MRRRSHLSSTRVCGSACCRSQPSDWRPSHLYWNISTENVPWRTSCISWAPTSIFWCVIISSRLPILTPGFRVVQMSPRFPCTFLGTGASHLPVSAGQQCFGAETRLGASADRVSDAQQSVDTTRHGEDRQRHHQSCVETRHVAQQETVRLVAWN